LLINGEGKTEAGADNEAKLTDWRLFCREKRLEEFRFKALGDCGEKRIGRSHNTYSSGYSLPVGIFIP
jgi:hypothetical protein